MPTIDELAPATAAADSDAFPVSQNNVTRKISRSQVLAGVQPQIVIPSGTILGRAAAGTGSPETIAIGGNLSLSAGTLSANAAPFLIGLLAGGLTPTGKDQIALGQGGKNLAVSYSIFFQGLSTIGNVDGTQLVVTPTGSSIGIRLADFAASVVSKSGASLSGALSLAGDPSAPLQAATRQYVDLKINRAGDTLSGLLQLSGDPVTALHAATKSYVDSNSGLLRLGFTMTGPITLVSDPVSPLNPASKSYADTRISRSGDTMSGLLALASDPSAALQAATKNYVDLQFGKSLPVSGGTMTGPVTILFDATSPLHATNKQYADTKVAKSGDTLSGPLTLSGNPVNFFHATTKGYVDSQNLTVLPTSGGTMTGPITLSGDPIQPAQASTKFYVDKALATSLPTTGGTLGGPLTLTAAVSAPGHAVNKQYIDTQLSNVLPLTGGSLTGVLSLASAVPISPLHAATKQYVDANPGPTGVINVRLPPCNAKFDGKSDDTAAFQTAYQLAPAGGTIYVPSGTTVMQASIIWGLDTTKRVKWIVDGTMLSDGTPLADAIPTGGTATGISLPATVSGYGKSGIVVSQSTSQNSDFAVLHSSYVVNHTGVGAQSVLTNSRTDTVITSNPHNHIWSGFDRLVWSGSQTPLSNSPAKHVGRYVQVTRQSAGTDATGNPLPQPMMWGMFAEYRDATARPSSFTNVSIGSEIDWIGNGSDDTNQRQIQSLVLAQNDVAGASVEVSTALGVSIANGSSGKIYRVFNVATPFSVSVLDTSAATQLAGAAAIRMAAGHAIAFEPTNSVNLSYSATTKAIAAKYGSTNCAIGKGLSVAFGVVFITNATLSANSCGSIVFLAGSGTYTITLPAAGALMAGTGFTFSGLGTGTVNIVPASGDTLELAPVVLRQYDRYHIVSDGSSLWREVFRSNAVSPRYSAPPVLPSYTVANLPASGTAGAKAFAANGRKPGESPGTGTGVELFHDGLVWISVCSGQPVLA